MCSFAQPVRATESPKSVVIYQVQTGTANATTQEYISIYNNTDQPLDVTNWCIVYATASDATQTQLSCIKPPNTKTKLMVKAYQAVTFATSEFVQTHPGYAPDALFSSTLSGTSGHVKLLDQSKSVIDTIGWGSATKPEGSPIQAHANGKVLQRKVAQAPVLQDSNSNLNDFSQTDLILAPGGNIYEEQVIYECAPEYPLCIENHPIITELFPDPEGADVGKEFIELHNPSSHPINLKGYSLQLGPNFTKSFFLPNTVLAPNQYISFSDTESGITLPNTNATIRLVSPMGEVVNETSYSNISEGQSMAHIDGAWQLTYEPSPSALNTMLANKPCKANQSYDEETQMCRTVKATAVPATCKQNQIRNVETGRCRNMAAAALVTTCKAGQEKNPLTNRCRNIVAAQTAKTCPAGQQRNSETNRCRKIVANAGATGTVKDVPSPLIKNNVKWWIAGISLIGASTYALFEWRQEFLNIVIAIRSRFAVSA